MRVLFSLAALCLILLAGNPAAADEAGQPRRPLFTSPPPAPAWSGLYIGLNGGMSVAEKRDTTFQVSAPTQFPTVPAGSFASPPPVNATGAQKALTSFSAGAQVGYNHKVNERLMLGVEADIQRNGAGF